MADINLTTVISDGSTIGPYVSLLEAYIGAWVDDLVLALREDGRELWRGHRNACLDSCMAGIEGDYEDTLLSIVATEIGASPIDLWKMLYTTAYKRARSS